MHSLMFIDFVFLFRTNVICSIATLNYFLTQLPVQADTAMVEATTISSNEE